MAYAHQLQQDLLAFCKFVNIQLNAKLGHVQPETRSDSGPLQLN